MAAYKRAVVRSSDGDFLSDGLSVRLRKARERVGLSQSEVSRRAGLSRMTCSDIEGGRRMGNVGVRTVELLAQVLGTTPSWLAFGGETPEWKVPLGSVRPQDRIG